MNKIRNFKQNLSAIGYRHLEFIRDLGFAIWNFIYSISLSIFFTSPKSICLLSTSTRSTLALT